MRVVLLVLLGLGPWLDPAVVRGDDNQDLEPVPPSVLHRRSSTLTQPMIADLISNSFGDRTKAPAARRQLVHRYHVISVPELLAELQNTSRNESTLWNTLLTIAALRDTWGAAPEARVLIEPLLETLRGEKEPFRRAFAALALGCFRHREGTIQDEPVLDPMRVSRTTRIRDVMRQSAHVLGRTMVHPNSRVRCASLLALAKRGGPDARKVFLDTLPSLQRTTGPERWAAVLAEAFLQPESGSAFFAPLEDRAGESRDQRAAALALSVAMLSERGGEGADWRGDAKRIFAALDTGGRRTQIAGPEIVFARGVCTWRNQIQKEWRSLWNIAVKPTTEDEVSIAIAQALLFCADDKLITDSIRWAEGKGDFEPRTKEALLAGVLLLSTQSGRPEAIEVAAKFLRNGARAPKAKKGWDVRFHAIVGLLRAFELGVIDDEATRIRVLDLLEGSLRHVHRDAPIRGPLAAFLETYGEKIRGDAFFRVPEKAVREVEASCSCGHGLFARDLREVCLHRVNNLVDIIFDLEDLPNPKPGDVDGVALYFMKGYLEPYPYFLRTEFLLDRGWREPLRLPSDDPLVIDR